MPARNFIITAVLVLLAVAFAACGQKEEKLRVDSGVAVRIGNKKIMNGEIDRLYESLPPQQQDNFKGPGGRAKFVDLVINEELVYLEAKKKGLQNDESVRNQIEAAERKILVAAFYQKAVMDKIEIKEEEIQRYYDDHQMDYVNPGLFKAQHIFSADSMKCVRWKERIDAGEKFSAIAKAESEDLSTAESYGNLGYFNVDGYVKFIGKSKTFTRDLESLEIGEVSGVIKHERGYSLVRLNDKKPSSLKPLSEVRNSIMDKMRSEIAEEKFNQELQKLRSKYKPENLAQEELMSITRTPDQLWEVAQAEDASYTKILYYRELVNKYPDHELAPKALFMIGFVYSEELTDYVQARRTFDELLENYPDSEVASSAKWMMENMDRPHPKFESYDNVKEQMNKE